MLAALSQWSPVFVSVTAVTGARTVTFRSLIAATSRSPAVVAALGEADSVALPDAFFAPNDWATPTGAPAVAARPVETIPLAQNTPARQSVEPTTTRARPRGRRSRGLRRPPKPPRNQPLIRPASVAGSGGGATCQLPVTVMRLRKSQGAYPTGRGSRKPPETASHPASPEPLPSIPRPEASQRRSGYASVVA